MGKLKILFLLLIAALFKNPVLSKCNKSSIRNEDSNFDASKVIGLKNENRSPSRTFETYNKKYMADYMKENLFVSEENSDNFQITEHLDAQNNDSKLLLPKLKITNGFKDIFSKFHSINTSLGFFIPSKLNRSIYFIPMHRKIIDNRQSIPVYEFNEESIHFDSLFRPKNVSWHNSKLPIRIKFEGPIIIPRKPLHLKDYEIDFDSKNNYSKSLNNLKRSKRELLFTRSNPIFGSIFDNNDKAKSFTEKFFEGVNNKYVNRSRNHNPKCVNHKIGKNVLHLVVNTMTQFRLPKTRKTTLYSVPHNFYGLPKPDLSVKNQIGTYTNNKSYVKIENKLNLPVKINKNFFNLNKQMYGFAKSLKPSKNNSLFATSKTQTIIVNIATLVRPQYHLHVPKIDRLFNFHPVSKLDLPLKVHKYNFTASFNKYGKFGLTSLPKLSKNFIYLSLHLPKLNNSVIFNSKASKQTKVQFLSPQTIILEKSPYQFRNQKNASKKVTENKILIESILDENALKLPKSSSTSALFSKKTTKYYQLLPDLWKKNIFCVIKSANTMAHNLKSKNPNSRSDIPVEEDFIKPNLTKLLHQNAFLNFRNISLRDLNEKSNQTLLTNNRKCDSNINETLNKRQNVQKCNNLILNRFTTHKKLTNIEIGNRGQINKRVPLKRKVLIKVLKKPVTNNYNIETYNKFSTHVEKFQQYESPNKK